MNKFGNIKEKNMTGKKNQKTSSNRITDPAQAAVWLHQSYGTVQIPGKFHQVLMEMVAGEIKCSKDMMD